MTKQTNNKGCLIVLSGPSGVGKTSIAGELIKNIDNLSQVVTYTSREKRPGEVDKQDYYFVTAGEFRKLLDKDHFLEWAEVHNHLYGTPAPAVQEERDAGNHVLLVIDVQGGLAVREKTPEALLIFVQPDNLENLEKRIKERKQNMSEEDLVIRLANARKEIEIAQQRYDHIVTNKQGDIEKAVKSIKKLINDCSQ